MPKLLVKVVAAATVVCIYAVLSIAAWLDAEEQTLEKNWAFQ